MPVSKIAAEIGRHRSTVYREIKRNHFEDEELLYLKDDYPLTAQDMYEKRRVIHRKPELKAVI